MMSWEAQSYQVRGGCFWLPWVFPRPATEGSDDFKIYLPQIVQISTGVPEIFREHCPHLNKVASIRKKTFTLPKFNNKRP